VPATRARSLEAAPFPGFGGGLNLRDQPNQVDPTQAVDLLNVTLIEREGIRSRDGYSLFTASPLTNQPDSLAAFYTIAGTAQLVVGNGNRLDALNTSGTSVANAAPTASPHYFTRFGGPTAELLFISNGTDSVRQWNGTAFSTPAYTGTAPTGRFVAVTPWDNRLVNARRSGAVAGNSPSTVFFSDPGVPTTFGVNNYVDLAPGDGEAITGIVAWERYVFVFKETKFFRFYGTSNGPAGTPIFNYEGVSDRVGLVSSRALTAGRDGVYFLDRGGVYRTTGSRPELVSPTLDPLFAGIQPDFMLTQPINAGALTTCAMAFHREQVYLALPTGTSSTNNRLLAYDPRYGHWTMYDIPAAALASFRVSTSQDLMFAYAAGTKNVGRHAIGLTTDAGATIASRWTSGWWDLGEQRRKTVRESLAWGKGKVRMGLGADFVSPVNTTSIAFAQTTDTWGDGASSADKWSDGTNSADVWAAGLRVVPKLNRQAARGTMFSLALQNVDATAWSVYRLTLRLRENSGARPY
jgi:hypothetical protein